MSIFKKKKNTSDLPSTHRQPSLILLLPPSIPVSACTIVSDPSCTEVSSITCDDVPPSPSSACEVRLQRSFAEPGTYCVNITLEDAGSTALTSTTVTINKSQDAPGGSLLLLPPPICVKRSER